MNICKYCKRLGIYNFMTVITLMLKHIVFFVMAMLDIWLKENILLNITVIMLWMITDFCISKHFDINTSLLKGAYLGILITANFQLTAEKYRQEILWDGDWTILKNKKYNFEHKKDIYIYLCGCLSDIMAMIVDYYGESYRSGRLMSVQHFNDAVQRYQLWRLEQFQPNFNNIDQINSFSKFVRYVNSFSRIDEIISSLQNIQIHLNSYCSKFNVKSTVGLLLNELFITSSTVKELRVFIKNSSVNDDAYKWYVRLNELLEQKQINIDALDNNVRNLVIHLSLMYNDINNDYDFSSKEG